MIFFIFQAEIFINNKKLLDKELKNYLENGYLGAYSFIRNDSIFIETGNLFYIRNVNIQSPIKVDSSIFHIFLMKPFTKKNMEALTDTINYYFSDFGFPFNEIIPEFSINDTFVDIDFIVILKDLYKIKKIILNGNVRNRSLFKEIYKLSDLPYSRRNLLNEIKNINSSKIIKVDSFSLQEEDNGINVILFVSNISYSDISGGLSFQSNEGWNFNFTGDFFNPFGFGTLWRIKFERLINEKTFSTRLQIPLLQTGNNFFISYSLITSLDTLIINNFSFKHVYKFRNYRIGDGIKYTDKTGAIKQKLVLYNFQLGYRKNTFESFSDFKNSFILKIKTEFNFYKFSLNTISSFTNKNMKDEENFFPVVRGYPYTYNYRVISISLNYDFFKKRDFGFYAFFDYNIYPAFNKKYSTGCGISKDRFNLEIAYPFEFGIRNIMLVLRLSPVDFFDNP